MKRQIANVNTHIFRHPFIPWGQRSYPLSLQPDLLLDAIDLNALILNGTDTVSLLDQSAQLAETNVYTSDFSSSVDGIVAIETVLVVNQTVGGETEALKIYADGTGSTHRAYHLTSTGKSGSTSLRFYIPSTNTNVDGFSINSNAGLFYDGKFAILDSWIEIPNSKGLLGVTLIINQFKGSSAVFTGANDSNDDIIYIKNWEINEIAGSHFTQATAANRPIVDSATVPTQIDFTSANSEFLENTLDVATFAAMSQGSIVSIYDSNASYQYSITNSSASNSYFVVGTNNNTAALWVFNQTNPIRFEVDTSPSNGDVIIWRSSGSIVDCSVNGLSAPISIVAGSDNNEGQWISNIPTLDNMKIGALEFSSGVIYKNTTFKHLMIRSTPLTDAESLTYANYLIQKHSL